MTRQVWGRVVVLVAIALAMSVSYYVGKKQQRMDDALVVNHVAIVHNDSVTKTDSAKVDSTRKWADTVVIYRDRVRAKVEVKSDTILVHDSVVVVSPEVAQLIQADDSVVAALRTVVAAQDTLIASLRKGLDLRDERIKLLESKGTSRFSKGVQLGVGYCKTATGDAPCIYAGYGVQIKL